MSDRMLTDLFLAGRRFDNMYSNRTGVDLGIDQGDLELVGSRENLAQALINRLLTHRGKLGLLGHPDYGSKLHLLIGEPNSRRTRARAELYIRESLAHEKRIKEIGEITVREMPRQGNGRDELIITVVVIPVDDEKSLTVTMNMNLEGM